MFALTENVIIRAECFIGDRGAGLIAVDIDGLRANSNTSN